MVKKVNGKVNCCCGALEMHRFGVRLFKGRLSKSKLGTPPYRNQKNFQLVQYCLA